MLSIAYSPNKDMPILRKQAVDGPIHLYCLPYAGAGGGIFARWQEAFTDDVVIHPLVLPGRERRVFEKPHVAMRELICDLVTDLSKTAIQRFALLGHSFGALVAFELARTLSGSGREPECLFILGAAAPSELPFGHQVSNLSDEQFLAYLHRQNEKSQELLSNPELLAIILPALRADFLVLENYRYQKGPPLKCNIVAFGGEKDAMVGEPGLRAWAAHTHGSYDLNMLAGGHFFISDCRKELLSLVRRRLEDLVGRVGVYESI